MTSQSTWMDYFLILNITTITFIVIETCVVFYLASKKKLPPQWYALKLFVYFTTWTHLIKAITNIFCCCCCFMRGRSSSDGAKVKVSGRDVNDLNDEFGLNAYTGESKDGIITESPFYGNSNAVDINVVLNQGHQRKISISLDKPPIKKPISNNTDRSSNSNNNNLNSVRSITSSSKDYAMDKPLEWPRIGQSIDVVLQIIVTLTYIICITIFIVQALEQYK